MRQLIRQRSVHALAVALSATAVMACRPKPPAPPATPEPPPPSVAAPAMESGAHAIGVADTAGAPPAAAPRSAPSLASMNLAKPSGKLGVPVDLRYQFEGDASSGAPLTLHLAAVPRADAGPIEMTVKEVTGLLANSAPVRAQKSTAGSALRQKLSITRLPDAPAEVRVLVTMELSGGLAFGYFSVPFESPASTTKPLRSTLQ